MADTNKQLLDSYYTRAKEIRSDFSAAIEDIQTKLAALNADTDIVNFNNTRTKGFTKANFLADLQHNAKIGYKLSSGFDTIGGSAKTADNVELIDGTIFDPATQGMVLKKYYDPTNPSVIITNSVSTANSHNISFDHANSSAQISTHRWYTRSIFKFTNEHFWFDRRLFRIPVRDLVKNGPDDVYQYYKYPEEIVMVSKTNPKNFIYFINMQYEDAHRVKFGNRYTNLIIAHDRIAHGEIDDGYTSVGTPKRFKSRFKKYTSVYANNIEDSLAIVDSCPDTDLLLAGDSSGSNSLIGLYLPVPDPVFGEELIGTEWDCRIMWRYEKPKRNQVVYVAKMEKFYPESGLSDSGDLLDFDYHNGRMIFYYSGDYNRITKSYNLSECLNTRSYIIDTVKLPTLNGKKTYASYGGPLFVDGRPFTNVSNPPVHESDTENVVAKYFAYKENKSDYEMPTHYARFSDRFMIGIRRANSYSFGNNGSRSSVKEKTDTASAGGSYIEVCDIDCNNWYRYNIVSSSEINGQQVYGIYPMEDEWHESFSSPWQAVSRKMAFVTSKAVYMYNVKINYNPTSGEVFNIWCYEADTYYMLNHFTKSLNVFKLGRCDGAYLETTDARGITIGKHVMVNPTNFVGARTHTRGVKLMETTSNPGALLAGRYYATFLDSTGAQKEVRYCDVCKKSNYADGAELVPWIPTMISFGGLASGTTISYTDVAKMINNVYDTAMYEKDGSAIFWRMKETFQFNTYIDPA